MDDPPDNFIPDLMRFREEGVPELDRDKFVDAFHHAYKAAAFPGNPFPDPTEKGLTIDNEDGTASRLSFTDVPENRVAFAILQRYTDDRMFGMIFLMRYMSLGQVWGDPRCERWKRIGDDGQEEINEATIHAAAVAPMTDQMLFDLDRYFEIVEEIYNEDENDDSPDDANS